MSLKVKQPKLRPLRVHSTSNDIQDPPDKSTNNLGESSDGPYLTRRFGYLTAVLKRVAPCQVVSTTPQKTAFSAELSIWHILHGEKMTTSADY